VQALEGINARVGAAEREHAQIAARLDGALTDMRGHAGSLGQRLRRVEEEAAGARSAEALNALEAVTARVETVGARSAEALSALEAVTERVEAAEREQVQVAARFEGALQEIKGDTGAVSQRLEKIEDEAAGLRNAEALRSIEGAIGQVAGHVYEAEKRSRDVMGELRSRVERLDAADQATVSAIRELKNSCVALDQRLSLSERGAEEGIERAAAQLSARVDETREELARQLSAAADARFDRVEQSLAQMSNHVRTAEHRSADALDRMGREVLQVAQTLNRRVQTAEQNSNAAADRVGAEVSRIAGAVENRLASADSIQAKALEKLGGEIARITERLAERIANAERRSAQAIDDVGEQVTRVTERINERSERSAGELADRIRQSEERTAKLLEEARQKLEDRLAETQRRAAEPPPAPAPTPSLLRPAVSPFAAGPFETADDADDEALFEHAPFPDFEAPTAAAAAPAVVSPAFVAPAFVAPEPPPVLSRPAPAPFDEEDFAAASTFGKAPIADPFDDDMGVLDDAAPEQAPEPAPPPIVAAAVAPTAATLFDADLDDVELEPNVGFDVDDELIGPASNHQGGLQASPVVDTPLVPVGTFGAAVAPAPQSVLPEPAAEAEPAEPAQPLPPAEAPHAAAPLTTREVIERARAAARASSEGPRLRAPSKPAEESMLQGLSFGRSRRKPNGPTGALMVASLMAAIGLSAGGYVLFEGKPGGKLPKRVADALSVVTGNGQNADTSMAAVALTSNPNAPAAVAGPDLSSAYNAAVAKLTSGHASGLADVRRLADGGYAPAQFYLAELYQNGKGGLAKDPTQARGLLERAAGGGDRNAMYNLALDEHEGVGGPKNAAAAAEWFRRAAELGLVDSQFNLAALYERGDGVGQNPAEAYKWYLIAGRNGDAESKAGALRVRDGLTPDARSVAERAAAGFQPTQASPATAAAAAAPAAVAPAAAPSPDLVTAQRALNQLGYYQGPTDGAASQALHLAIAAYQRDQNLPVTGNPDPATIGKLAVYTR
jgi:localization factor PodJL